MNLKCSRLVTFVFTLVLVNGISNAGVLKSLDQELSELVGKTDPYLVTVRGISGWRNLVATGVVFDSRGYVVTSSQIYDADNFTVTFKNGRSVRAEKTGVDQLTGLAVLRISGANPATPKWGDSQGLSGGALITVVGNSYEVPATFSFGGYLGKTEDGLLKLGVNVSPGASGSAVLDVGGDLIGILVAREARQGVAISDSPIVRASETAPNLSLLISELGAPDAVCYAVPSAAVKEILDQIISEGKVSRGYLGITSQNLEPAFRQRHGLSGGVAVTGLDPKSPAELAGIKPGDVIVTVDMVGVTDRGALLGMIRSRKPGESVRIGLLRGNERIMVDAKLTLMQEKPFISGLELTQPSSAQAADGKALAGRADLASEVGRLRAELERLRSEMNDLKKEMRK